VCLASRLTMGMSKQRKLRCVVRCPSSYIGEQGSEDAPRINAETVGSHVLLLGLGTRVGATNGDFYSVTKVAPCQ
jgi:hypothetical protein